MDVVSAIENTSKGARDKPKEDIVIAKSGELPLPDTGVDAEGKQVPFRCGSTFAIDFGCFLV